MMKRNSQITGIPGKKYRNYKIISKFLNPGLKKPQEILQSLMNLYHY